MTVSVNPIIFICSGQFSVLRTISALRGYRGTSADYAEFSKAMNLKQQRERVTVDGLGNIGVGKWKRDLTNKPYSDIMHLKGKMSNIDVRKWYIAQKIP